jgi:hypothetical protein
MEFDEELFNVLSEFNNKYFPSPEYKRKVRNREIDSKKYGEEKEKDFLTIYYNLVKKHGIKLKQQHENQESEKKFIDKWYIVVYKECSRGNRLSF